MLLALCACYDPPALPPHRPVPIVPAPAEACRPTDEVVVACTVDGDTFDAGVCREGGERFRLLGIDAPETEKPGAPADCFAGEAWAWLTDRIEGQEVTVSFDRACTDAFGRSLAYVWLRGERFEDLADDPELEPYAWTWYEDLDEPAILLNEVLLGEGYARQYPEEIAGTLLFQERLDEAARDAAQFGRGLYGACAGG